MMLYKLTATRYALKVTKYGACVAGTPRDISKVMEELGVDPSEVRFGLEALAANPDHDVAEYGVLNCFIFSRPFSEAA